MFLVFFTRLIKLYNLFYFEFFECTKAFARKRGTFIRLYIIINDYISLIVVAKKNILNFSNWNCDNLFENKQIEISLLFLSSD